VRKILLTEFGGPEVLRVGDHPEPDCPADGWIVEIKAASINFADIVSRRGLYERDQKLPYEVGKEAAGVVVAKGPHAAARADGGHDLGDRVVVIRFAGGCYAERVAAGPGMLLPGPDDYDFDELAAFGIIFATAWYGMNELARVRAGESVLIQAAAGGVGTAAVALAKAHGCGPIIGTASGPEKCAWVEELGADACVDYTQADFRETVRELTGGRGVDYCLESVGGEVFEHSFASLAELGRIVIIGFSAIDSDYKRRIAPVHPLKVFLASTAMMGLNVQNLDFPRRRDVWNRMVAYLERTHLRPEIGARFSLEDAPAAHAALESRKTRGKVLLIP